MRLVPLRCIMIDLPSQPSTNTLTLGNDKIQIFKMKYVQILRHIHVSYIPKLIFTVIILDFYQMQYE